MCKNSHACPHVHTLVRGSRACNSHCSARATAGPAATLPAQQQAGTVTGPNYVTVDRNLAMELVRVTEAAALAGGAWLGKVLPLPRLAPLQATACA